MNAGTLRQGANVAAYVATLIVNYLAVSLPLGGHTTAEIANRYPIYFLPANFTFGIWGVIYLALGVFVVNAARPSQRDNALQRRIGYLFILSCASNIAWLILFQSLLFAASMVAMVALLAVLIAIYSRLEVGLHSISASARWLVTLPFSLYLGWISVATIANAAYVLYDAHWNGFGIPGATWAVIMLVVGAGLAVAMLATRHDIVFVLVVCWAFAGIAIKQSATPQVALSAEALTALLLVLAATQLVLRRRAPGKIASDAPIPTA